MTEKRAESMFLSRNQNPGEDFEAPKTALQKKIAGIWSETLGVSQIGLKDNFFDLGGNSLLVAKAITGLRKLWPDQTSMIELFESTNLEEFSQRLERAHLGQTTQKTEIDWRQEVKLDFSPNIEKKKVFSEPAQNIFLTGVTGFLGAFLLNELLEKTSARIHCLVRAPHIQEAKKRLEENLKTYHLKIPDWNRVQLHTGDLSSYQLGMDQQQFQKLSDSIDCIFHSGASTNFISPYNVMKLPNVVGTQEILRLAFNAGGTPVHFISTVSVLGSQDRLLLESDVTEFENLHGAYPQTKWISEEMIRQSHVNWKLPVVIYRPGNIASHSKTGAGNSADYTTLLIKGSLEMLVFPEINSEVDFTPVDFVGAAIVEISKNPKSQGVYHVTNPKPIKFSSIIEVAKSLGYKIKVLPFRQWLELIESLGSKSSLYPLLELIKQHSGKSADGKAPQYSLEKTESILKNSEVRWENPGTKELTAMFNYFIEIGFFPKPPS